MKTFACSCIWVIGCGFALADGPPDPKKEGSHSHLLSHSLAFEAARGDKEARFVATLTNVSNQKLKVQVNRKEFHAMLKATLSTGHVFAACDEKYLNLLQTAQWQEPTVELDSKKSITWVVPLTSLRTMHGLVVTHDSFSECSVISKMPVAVIPDSGNYVANNATQKSKPIVITSKR